MGKMVITAELKQSVFEYLDGLRQSGSINMFGSGQYVQQAFGMDKYSAKDLVLEWMNTFSERHNHG